MAKKIVNVFKCNNKRHDDGGDFPFIISTEGKKDFKLVFIPPEIEDDYLIIWINRNLYKKLKTAGIKDMT